MILVFEINCFWIFELNENWNIFDDVYCLYKGCMDVSLMQLFSFDGICYWVMVDGGINLYIKFVFIDFKG